MKEVRKIVSRDNPKLKHARKVRDGKGFEKIFIEGFRLAEEGLRSQLSIQDCFVSTEFALTTRGRELIDNIIAREISVHEVSDNLFVSIADTSNSQGIVLVGEKPAAGKSSIETNLRAASGQPALVIFLYEINDPSNLGAVLRTAEAAGVAGIVTSKLSADAFSTKAVRSSMGAGFRIPVWERASLEEALSWARERKLRLTAADVNKGKSYTSLDWTLPRFLVFGSEAHGLSPEVREKIDEIVYIPMKNNVESLNLAVSCGVILFEAIRQNSVGEVT